MNGHYEEDDGKFKCLCRFIFDPPFDTLRACEIVYFHLSECKRVMPYINDWARSQMAKLAVQEKKLVSETFLNPM